VITNVLKIKPSLIACYCQRSKHRGIHIDSNSPSVIPKFLGNRLSRSENIADSQRM
jgi:hypothetical protein